MHCPEPEENQRDGGEQAVPAEKAVVAALAQQLLQGHDDGQRRHVTEDHVGHAPFRELPYEENPGGVEVEDDGVDQQGGGEQVVQQARAQPVDLRPGAVEVVQQGQEKRRGQQ